MNIILLSGGSGTRLWPISHEEYPKQFVKFFKNENNDDISMLQRIYSNLSLKYPNANIVISTDKMYESITKEQIGMDAFLCLEPHKRGTFPAIVLSAAYLFYELDVDEEECVVVCPSDSYVDFSYYDRLKILEDVVAKKESNLTLIGINPTYPSEKYGYIIPTTREDISAVDSFKEKPSKEVANEYIEQGALWNAGVFAFKLGYLLDLAHKIIEFNDYKDLYEKYEQLEKISFDYCVVEKEKNIQVVKYDGLWNDMGTWNALFDVLQNDKIGKVVTSDDSTDVKVVNNLDIPLLLVGCSDLVVAAGDEGILICHKNEIENIRTYVDKINKK